MLYMQNMQNNMYKICNEYANKYAEYVKKYADFQIQRIYNKKTFNEIHKIVIIII